MRMLPEDEQEDNEESMKVEVEVELELEAEVENAEDEEHEAEEKLVNAAIEVAPPPLLPVSADDVISLPASADAPGTSSSNKIKALPGQWFAESMVSSTSSIRVGTL